LDLDNILTSHFDILNYNDFLNKLKNKQNLVIPKDKLSKSLINHTVKRASYYPTDFSSICFFGTSVTSQQYSYVSYIKTQFNNSTIYQNGYSGCHITHATWLINDVIILEPKPKICVVEWITSILKPSKDELKSYLSVICDKLIKHDIIPIFLYLFKTDINNYLDLVSIYEEVANYYNISSLFIYKIIQELKIQSSAILKDTCHTNYDGSNLYGLIIKEAIDTILLNSSHATISVLKDKSLLSKPINTEIYNKYKNIQIIPLNKIMNCDNIDNILFNGKIYYKIFRESVYIQTKSSTLQKTLIAINILYDKNNGFIDINDNKILIWDKNSYYKRFGYIDLNICFNNNNPIKISVSQESVDTSSCKYGVQFPHEKWLWLAEFILY
jgi:hypothetical protein